MIKRFYKFYFKESFQPTYVSILYSPYYLIRTGLFKNIKSFSENLGGLLLDFGCGSMPHKNLFKVEEYIGLDIEESGHLKEKKMAHVYYDGKSIPFQDEHFDSLFCSEVMEHVFEPDLILSEINRVLKKGAHCIFTIPFVWEEHEKPYDYARYTSFGFRFLLEKNGFEIIEVVKSGTFFEVMCQQSLVFIETLFNIFPKLLSKLMIIPFAAFFNIIAILLRPIFKANRNLYHNLIVYCVKK